MAGGSVGGPWGALIGGGLGGLAGLFGGGDKEAQQGRWENYDQWVQGQKANTAGESAFRNNQQQLIGQLEAMAAGHGPSLAGQMLKTATDRNVAQQQALAQTGAGNATMAAQGAANNSARLGAQSAQDAASARMAEQMGAVNQLGGVLQGARGQDQNLGMFNANAQNNMLNQIMAGRLAALGGMQGMANTPSLSDQILAGGAGMFSMGASQNPAGGGGGAGMPFGMDPLNQSWRRQLGGLGR